MTDQVDPHVDPLKVKSASAWPAVRTNVIAAVDKVGENGKHAPESIEAVKQIVHEVVDKKEAVETIIASTTEPTLDDLEAVELQLQLQLSIIKEKKRKAIETENAKRAEDLRRQRLEQPAEVVVTMFTGALVIITPGIDHKPREDVADVVRQVPGRVTTGIKKVGIPIGEWNLLLSNLTHLKNVTITYHGETEREIKWHLNAPVWDIEMKTKFFTVAPGPRAIVNTMYSIPGANWVADRHHFTVPLTEGWRVWDRLKEVEGVVWTEAGREFVLAQAEKRMSLDKIALMNRGEKFKDFEFGPGLMLRPFQEVGAEFIDATDGQALLADEMGLGKTWQILATIKKNNWRAVIFCPASLKPNWAREVYRLMGVRAVVLSGAEPTDYDMRMMIMNPPQICIINYDILGRKNEIEKKRTDEMGNLHVENQTRFFWAELINLSKPDVLVLDEAHYIKNVDSNRSKAARSLTCPRVVGMTGTPVLNRPGELWPILNMIAPDTFPSYKLFLDQYTHDGKTARNVEELRGLLKPIMIRRLKMDVMADLPEINHIETYHELSTKARKLYEKIEQGVYISIAAYDAHGHGGNEMGITSILAQIMRWKQVCAADKVSHTVELAQEAYESADPREPRKVIIFTQFKGTCHTMHRLLEKSDPGSSLCFVSVVKGGFKTADVMQRDKIIQQFQNDPKIKYVVVTENTTKEGHNITAAGTVIFNDLFWTPAAHSQAEGRAYGRMDNAHSINSNYMITDMDGESIEEWIMKLLERKQGVINVTVEGLDSDRDVSILTDLLTMMREKMYTRAGV